MKYRIELTAWLEATYVLEIEAEDAATAKLYAIQQHPVNAEMWTVLPSPSPARIDVFSCERIK